MIQRFDVGPRLSEMAIHNGVVYLAGQVAEDATQGIAAAIGAAEEIIASDPDKYWGPHQFENPANPAIHGGV